MKPPRPQRGRALLGIEVDCYISKIDGEIVIHVDTPNVPDNARGPVCRIYLNDDTDSPLWNNPRGSAP